MRWTDTKVQLDGLGPFPARLPESEAGRGGHVTPRFTRETAERVARESNELGKGIADWSVFTWEGDRLILDERAFRDDPNYEPVTSEPDSDGYYIIGYGMWIWEEALGDD